MDLKTLTSWSEQRQFLAEPAADALTALKRVVGVYSSHPCAPLSLKARVKEMTADDCRALEEDGRTARVPAMRLSMHMVPGDDLDWIFPATVPPADDPSWAKRYGSSGRGLPDEAYPNYAAEVMAAAREPRSGKEIKALVDVPEALVKTVINRLSYEGRMLRISGPKLRSDNLLYLATSARFPDFEPSSVEDCARIASARVRLAEAYLRGYGPARVEDFRWWASLTVSEAESAMSALETVGLGDDLLLLAEDEPAFCAFKAERSDSLCILPDWDSYIMGYAPDGRARFVDEAGQAPLYGKKGATKGNALACIVYEGRVVALWQGKIQGKRWLIGVQPFSVLPTAIKKRLQGAFEDTATYLECGEVVLSLP